VAKSCPFSTIFLKCYVLYVLSFEPFLAPFFQCFLVLSSFLKFHFSTAIILKTDAHLNSQLAADPDRAVKNGAELLDRLVKEVVCKNKFDLPQFIPVLKKSVEEVSNPDCRRVCLHFLLPNTSKPKKCTDKF
jgi:hypothetical protein